MKSMKCSFFDMSLFYQKDKKIKILHFFVVLHERQNFFNSPSVPQSIVKGVMGVLCGSVFFPLAIVSPIAGGTGVKIANAPCAMTEGVFSKILVRVVIEKLPIKPRIVGKNHFSARVGQEKIIHLFHGCRWIIKLHALVARKSTDRESFGNILFRNRPKFAVKCLSVVKNIH